MNGNEDYMENTEMKVLAKFFVNCGRMGNLEGLFISTKEEVKNCIGKEVCFYEVLGKHSEINGVIEDHEIAILSEDQEFINKLQSIVGKETISGVNPIHNARQREEELDESEQ